MKKPSKITPVKGGWIKRDAASGRFMEVHTANGAAKASQKTEAAVSKASSKRSSALKRLADR